MIIEHQAVAFKLADMRTRVDASRLLYMRAASMAMTGKPFTSAEGSMAKLFAGETAVWVTEQAIQILGACGCSCEHPVERWHRDAKRLHDLRGYERGPAARHRQSDIRRGYSLGDRTNDLPDHRTRLEAIVESAARRD